MGSCLAATRWETLELRDRVMAISNEELERCRGMIRDAGLRATSSRIAVLALLRTEESALSHSEVAEFLEAASWDRATLYRNLVDMTEAGLLRRVELGDHTYRFEVVDRDHEDGEHPHFVCSECGTVECLPELEFHAKAKTVVPQSVRKRQFAVQLRGICDDCG